MRGGSERHMFVLSKILRDHGHRVIPFSMQDEGNKPSKYSQYFITYVDLHKFSIKNIIKFFYNYEAVRKLKKIIKKEKPDIAHLHNIAHQFSPAIIRVLKRANIKIVQTLHDYKNICPNAKLYNKQGNCQKCQGGRYYHCFTNKCVHNSFAKSFLAMLEAYLYNRILKIYDQVDMFIAPSKFMKEVSIRFGVPAEKIKVLYNFLHNRPKTISELDIANNKNYFLYFGRLSKEKGIETVLAAMEELKSLNIKFVIVGRGPDENFFRQAVIKKGLSEQVELVGFKSGQELNDLVSQAQAIIMPSLWPENMPYSLLEAMSMGKIIIASLAGGMPELLQDGQNAFTFTPGNEKQLAKKIQQVIALDIKNILKIAQKAQKTIEKLNAEQYYDELIQLYQT